MNNQIRLFAGVAKCEITNDNGDVAISDPLYAKALILNHGNTNFVLITMDAVAIGGICDIEDDFLPKLRARVESDLGIPGRHLLVNASHTHPPGRILCSSNELINRTFDAVRRAKANMKMATIGSGSGYESRLTMNRNLKMKNGQHWTIRHANPCPPDGDVVDVGPIDPEVGVLRVDHVDGTPLAVVYNFACHLLFADPAGCVTANIPGVASRVIEENWGFGTMAFFIQGAAGDVIDVHFKDFTRPRDINGMGTTLGLKVLQVLRDITPKESGLFLLSEDVNLPRRVDIPQKLEILEEDSKILLESLRFTSLNFKTFLPLYLRAALHPECAADYSYIYLREKGAGRQEQVAMDSFNIGNIRKYLENIQAMEKLARIQDEVATYLRHQAINKESGANTIRAEIQGVSIGDCAIVSAPIEVLTEVSLNIKSESPFERTFIAGFSNGYMHYGPPATDYNKGGYETIECFLAPEWQQIFENKVGEILQGLKKRLSPMATSRRSDYT